MRTEYNPWDYKQQRGSRFCDENGEPVARTKYTHPYSYDPFVIWKGAGKANGTVYTDRLFEWDRRKAEDLCDKHLPGLRWNNAPPSKIEAFLREYMGEPNLRLVLVMEYCNWATGYPVWRLDYITEAKDPPPGEPQ